MPMHMITEAVNLGIHAMLVLTANPERRLSTTNIAEVLRVSPSHLAKVMQKLARARLVYSMRGTTGGFLLAHPPGEISVARILDAVDPEVRFDSCMLHLPRCKKGNCPVSDLHDSVHQMVRERFEKMVLTDFSANIEELMLPKNG
ncbi:Rrf2 family transcriptional regulator [Myxococcota bacterium]|nr:Rrf2 family transcriptional regulator [Myxococcota bacterium]MBU1511831.1 Rrf2 family transcriptional regulator [Myxococcota bacterium]